jgi:short chain dehydrogenase
MKRSYASISKLLAVSATAGFLLSRILSRNYLNAGQVAIITGGSRGLGLALAHRFGKAGVKLVLAARGEEELERALAITRWPAAGN